MAIERELRSVQRKERWLQQTLASIDRRFNSIEPPVVSLQERELMGGVLEGLIAYKKALEAYSDFIDVALALCQNTEEKEKP